MPENPPYQSRHGHGDDKDPDLENIDSDEEYEMACDAFDALLDEADLEEDEEESAEGADKGIAVEKTDGSDIKKLGW